MNSQLLSDDVPEILNELIAKNSVSAEEALRQKGVFAVPTGGVLSQKNIVFFVSIESYDVSNSLFNKLAYR